MVDFVDFGVGVSMLSKAKLCCLGVLDPGLGLVFCSEYGLEGVSWKFFRICFSCGFSAGSCLSNQFHHHGNPPDRVSVTGVCVDFGVAFHNWWQSE